MGVLDRLQAGYEIQETMSISEFIVVVGGWYGVEKKEAIEIVCRWVMVDRLPVVAFIRGILSEYLPQGDAGVSAMYALVEMNEMDDKTRVDMGGDDKYEELIGVMSVFQEVDVLLKGKSTIADYMKGDNLQKPRFGDLIVLAKDVKALFVKLGLGDWFPWKYPARMYAAKPDVEELLGVTLTNGDYIEGLTDHGWFSEFSNEQENSRNLIQYQEKQPTPKKGSPESLREWIKYIITVEEGLSLTEEMPDGLQARLIREAAKYGYKDGSAVKKAWSALGLVSDRKTTKMKKPPKTP